MKRHSLSTNELAKADGIHATTFFVDGVTFERRSDSGLFLLSPEKRSHRKQLGCFSTVRDSSESRVLSTSQGLRIGGMTGLHLLDPETLEHRFVALPMSTPHSLIQNSIDKRSVVATPRDQADAVVVDLSNNSIVGRISLSRGEKFYGHGCFSTDGEQRNLDGIFKVIGKFV